MSMPGLEEMMCGEIPEIIEFFGHDDLPRRGGDRQNRGFRILQFSESIH